MFETKNQQVINPNTIPIIENGTTNFYDPEKGEITITEGPSLHDLIFNFVELQITLEPDQLKILQQLDYQLANQNADVFGTIIIDDGSIFLCCNEKFLKWAETQKIADLENLLQEFSYLRRKSKWWGITPTGETSVKETNVRDIAILLVKKVMEIPTEVLSSSNRLHELKHYIDIAGTNESAVLFLNQTLLETYTYYTESAIQDSPEEEQCLLFAVDQRALFEAAAIAHEIFGPVISEKTAHFKENILAAWLLQLLENFADFSFVNQPSVIGWLTSELTNKSAPVENAEYNAATVLLLFGDKILSPNGSINLELLIPEDKKHINSDEKVHLLTTIIVDRVKEVTNNFKKFEEEFLSKDIYSLIQKAIFKLNKSIFEYIANSKAPDVSPTFQDQQKREVMEQAFT